METYKPSANLPLAIMVDIDGTLAHAVDRSPFEWHKVGQDSADETVVQVVTMYAAYVHRYKSIIMSGRDSVCRKETEDWLDLYDIPYDHLYMRAESDNRKDSIVKRELFDKHIRDKFNIKLVLDDRNQVVDMWRDLGLKVFQVASGDF